MNFSERLGIRLAEMRREKKLTQKGLAGRLSHSPLRNKLTASAVSKWELGENEMSVSTFREICRILGADANELLELNK